MADPDPDWRRLNRANWDERVPVHRAVPYGNGDFADGTARLNPIEAAELGLVAGLQVLHLQCHFGRDTLLLAQAGADVTGLDFSAPAIDAARADSAALGIPARFVQADVYDALHVLPPASFDLVFTTWGTINWLPDIAGWAGVVSAMLRPGGRLYFADIHPTALVFDDCVPGSDGRPGWFAPYFEAAPLHIDDASDYADPAARLRNSRTVQFMHPLSGILGALAAAGMRLDWLHEHPRLTWQAFRCLVEDAEGCWTWPDEPWFPLALSLGATRT